MTAKSEQLRAKLEAWLAVETDAPAKLFLTRVEAAIASRDDLTDAEIAAVRAWAKAKSADLPLAWACELEELQTRAPYYVALVLHELLDDVEHYAADRPRWALFGLCEAVEVTARLLAVAATADLIAENGGVAPEWLVAAVREDLRSPTFGRWLGIVRTIAAHGGTPAFPDIAEASDRLAALTRREDRTEQDDIVQLRNALAHGGGGVSDRRAAKLLEHWGPRVAAALAALPWLTACTVWAREDDAIRRLIGFEPVTEDRPPSRVRDVLGGGHVVLTRGDRVVPLHPFGRSSGGVELPSTQLYAKEGRVGLIYSLFGDEAGLQVESLPSELEAFQKLFPAPEMQRRSLRDRALGLVDYDKEFRANARWFVGRAVEVDALSRAIRDTPRGVLSVLGPAGVGKSALIAKAIAGFDAERTARAGGERREEILVYRFRDGDRGCAPEPFLKWLVVRLEDLFGGDKLPDLGAGVGALRIEADRRLGALATAGIGRLVLVLDGLDELARREGAFAKDWLAQAARMERLLVVVGSRPETDALAILDVAGAVPALEGGLGAMSAADVRAMLLERLPRIAKAFVKSDLGDDGATNAFIEAVAERSEGLPNYVELVAQDCQGRQTGKKGRKGKKGATAGESDKGKYFATRRPDGAVEWNTADLPDSIAEYFRELTTRGALSDRARNGPLMAALLAWAAEPLSAAELEALLARHLGEPKSAQDLARRRAYLEEMLRDLGGLLISLSDEDLQVRYRLYHSALVDFVRRDPGLADTGREARRLLRAAARAPGSDAVSRYLHRNGVAHLLDLGEDDAERADDYAAAAKLLSDLPTLVERLQLLAPEGGDGGLRADWARVAARGGTPDRKLSEEAFAWRQFWATDGALFEPGEGRDAARELLERALEYAPDTVIGAAVDAWQ
jgi:hypothetical protein